MSHTREEITIEDIRRMTREEARSFYLAVWGASDAEANEMVASSHPPFSPDVLDAPPPFLEKRTKDQQ